MKQRRDSKPSEPSRHPGLIVRYQQMPTVAGHLGLAMIAAAAAAC
jgi:hypothetical protein